MELTVAIGGTADADGRAPFVATDATDPERRIEGQICCDAQGQHPVSAVLSTRSGDVGAGLIHSRTFTGTSGSYACAGLGTTCRG